jgi:rhomboid protease GluP
MPEYGSDRLVGPHNTGPEPDDTDEYEPGPEDFIDVPKPPPGPLSHFPSPRHALPAMFVFILCYICTLIYNRYPAGDLLWVSGDTIYKQHEYWRLLTSLLTHADPFHLLSNALLLVIFGWMLKAYFGPLAFPVVSFIIGFITNFITISFYEPTIKLLGVSGMAYGMVSLWLVFYIRNESEHSFPVRLFRAVGFALVMMFPTAFEPQVSYLAHAVGFLTGTIMGILLMKFFPVRNPQ